MVAITLMRTFFIVSNLPLSIVVSHRGSQKELLPYYCYNYVGSSGYYFTFCSKALRNFMLCWPGNNLPPAVVAVHRVTWKQCVTNLHNVAESFLRGRRLVTRLLRSSQHFIEPEVYYGAHKILPLNHILSHINPIRVALSCVSYILILSSHTLLCLSWRLVALYTTLNESVLGDLCVTRFAADLSLTILWLVTGRFQRIDRAKEQNKNAKCKVIPVTGRGGS
jgi:hypothetical protein